MYIIRDKDGNAVDALVNLKEAKEILKARNDEDECEIYNTDTSSVVK